MGPDTPLNQLQKDFIESSLVGKATEQLNQSLVNYSDDERDARLAIYRNNYYASMIDVVKDAFPTVEHIVGEEFFTALAKLYLRTHPPKNPSLIYFGKAFPEFLANSEHTQDLLYLPDCARLDHLQHLSYHAADENPVLPAAFSNYTPTELVVKKIRFLPSFKLLQSSYAIYSIWELNQVEGSHSKHVNAHAPESVLVLRQNLNVQIQHIENELYTFLNYLDDTVPIGESIELTMSQYSDFNASSAIAFLVGSEIIAEIID